MHIQTSITVAFTSSHILTDHCGFPVLQWKIVEAMKAVFVIRLCEIPKKKHRRGISVWVGLSMLSLFFFMLYHSRTRLLLRLSLFDGCKRVNQSEIFRVRSHTLLTFVIIPPVHVN